MAKPRRKAESFDSRTTPVRDDLAAAHLRNRVQRPRYAEGETRQVAVPVLPLGFRPGADARLESQLLFGEGFTVYDEAEGWAWGQSALDGYVGYVPADGLAAELTRPSHAVAATTSHLYPDADLKQRPLAQLSLASRVEVVEERAGYCRLAGGGWLFAKHLAPLDEPAPDYIGTGLRLLGVPYLWGGRSAQGVDCSGFLQLVLQRAGIACPRDTDQQAEALGDAVPEPYEPAALKHGDLVFFPGHVGIVLDGGRFLHANAFDMAVAVHPLDEVLARADAAGAGVSGARRLWAEAGPAPQ